MFDLENAITEWRRQMLASGIQSPVPLEELESHLRDDIDEQMRSGMSAPQAFAAATQRIGAATPLRVEFEKTGGLLAPLAATPGVLLAYTLFAALVTLADYIVLPLTSATFRAHLVPYTGWVACTFYSFTVFFAFHIIYQQKNRARMRLLGITVQMLLQIGFGVFQLFQMRWETFGDPYLTISPWRPVWTMLIPAIWIILLHSRRMNRFVKGEGERVSSVS